jgi:hypothetical protein
MGQQSALLVTRARQELRQALLDKWPFFGIVDPREETA